MLQKSHNILEALAVVLTSVMLIWPDAASGPCPQQKGRVQQMQMFGLRMIG